MKKVTMITLAALTLAAPSLAFAQNYNGNNNYNRGNNNVTITPPNNVRNPQGVTYIDGPDRNRRPDVVLIDGPDRNRRPDVIIVKDDDRRADWRRHDYYRSRHANYRAPYKFGHQNQCGIGQVSYRMPNGRISYENVYMCRQRNGEWIVANR
jgi:hypothetical protein